jgi:hypothetical protein
VNDDNRHQARRSADADGPASPDRPSMSMTGPGGHPDDVVLAGYVDAPDDLPISERQELEAHLVGCARCQQTLTELRAVVRALAALPEIQPARSFALTPEMVGDVEHYRTPTLPVSTPEPGARQPVVLQESSVWYARQMKAVRWATAVAALLFVLVLTADFSMNRLGGTTQPAADAPMIAAGSAPESYSVATPAPEEAPAASELRVMDTTPAADTAAGASEATATPAAAQEPAPAAEATPAEAPPAVVALPTEDSEADSADDAFVAAVEEQPVSVASEDRRSMSTSRHYWRLAQLGLAMLIVWLLAAMIALPRMNPRNRRE